MYRNPVNEFAAKFIGDANLVPGVSANSSPVMSRIAMKKGAAVFLHIPVEDCLAIRPGED